MSKYAKLKASAEEGEQNERTLIVVKVPLLLALIEERDELLAALVALCQSENAGTLMQAADAIAKARAE